MKWDSRNDSWCQDSFTCVDKVRFHNGTFFFLLSLWDFAEINARTDTKKPSKGNREENGWLSRQEILCILGFNIYIYIYNIFILYLHTIYEEVVKGQKTLRCCQCIFKHRRFITNYVCIAACVVHKKTACTAGTWVVCRVIYFLMCTCI